MPTTNTCADQVPINNTVQATVGPGDQTGVYYILVSNLPWNTAWQGLKDHIRQACPVDKVEVFNQSTSGWIRLKGRDNFDKAMSFVRSRQGHLNGRAILASGRNATESVVIRTRAVVSPSLNASAALRGTSSGTSMRSPTTPAAAGSWAEPATQAYYPSIMSSSTQYGYQEIAHPSWYSTATAQGGYDMQSATVATSTYQYQSGYGSSSQYPQQYTQEQQQYAQQQSYNQQQGYDQSGYYSSTYDQNDYQQSDYYNPGYGTAAASAAEAPATTQSTSKKCSKVVVAHGSWGVGSGGGSSSSSS